MLFYSLIHVDFFLSLLVIAIIDAYIADFKFLFL